MVRTATRCGETRHALLVLVMVLLVATAFMYWVWPTPWVYRHGEGSLHRTNLLTGHGEVYAGDPYGWVPEH